MRSFFTLFLSQMSFLFFFILPFPPPLCGGGGGGGPARERMLLLLYMPKWMIHKSHQELRKVKKVPSLLTYINPFLLPLADPGGRGRGGEG